MRREVLPAVVGTESQMAPGSRRDWLFENRRVLKKAQREIEVRKGKAGDAKVGERGCRTVKRPLVARLAGIASQLRRISRLRPRHKAYLAKG